MNLAQELEAAANAYEGQDIWGEILNANECDTENCTDYRAVYSDGSMLVLYGDKWEAEMFDASGDDLDPDVYGEA